MTHEETLEFVQQREKTLQARADALSAKAAAINARVKIVRPPICVVLLCVFPRVSMYIWVLCIWDLAAEFSEIFWPFFSSFPQMVAGINQMLDLPEPRKAPAVVF